VNDRFDMKHLEVIRTWKQLRVWPAVALLCAMALGCFPAPSSAKRNASSNTQKSESGDPVKSFEKVLALVEQQLASPREYLERAAGTYAQRPNFAGNPDDAGKPYEHYDKVLKEWRIKGYDVKRTDSLVSPYEAILVIEERESKAYGGKARLQRPDDVLNKPYEWVDKWRERKCTYSWRGGKWVPDQKRWPFDPTMLPREEENGGKKTDVFSYKRLK
jgi:hypothetical protein